MFVIIDERDLVTRGYAGRFGEEGVAAAPFDPGSFLAWVVSAPGPVVAAVEAFLIGDCPQREDLPPLIRRRSRAPVIALNEERSLERTLGLFQAGVDDVVRKPVHVRELLARTHAIRRRLDEHAAPSTTRCGDIECRFDCGDPIIGGTPFRLPRRERRILEHLVRCAGLNASKAEIAASVYGAPGFENAIETHICRLRKKLRERLGYDPIGSQRYLGYWLAAAPPTP